MKETEKTEKKPIVEILGTRPFEIGSKTFRIFAVIASKITCPCGYVVYRLSLREEPTFSYKCPGCKRKNEAQIVSDEK